MRVLIYHCERVCEAFSRAVASPHQHSVYAMHFYWQETRIIFLLKATHTICM